jgi:GNAT superfamily N-acetyltransferase
MPSLRDGRKADAGAVAALHIASWQAAYRGELPDAFLDNQSLSERTADWERRLGAGTRVALLEDASLLLGFAAFGRSRDADADPAVVWELHNLHILPDRRGGGLGRLLFDAAADEGRRAGGARLTLWVAERNLPARRFYERLRMQADGARQLHRLGPDAMLPEMRYSVAYDSR